MVKASQTGRGSAPVLVEESLSVCDRCISGQHPKRGRLPCSVHTKQAETLRNKTIINVKNT